MRLFCEKYWPQCFSPLIAGLGEKAAIFLLLNQVIFGDTKMTKVDRHSSNYQQERTTYSNFIDSHEKNVISYRGNNVEYYFCGSGEQAILLPPHISSLIPSEMVFRNILEFEKRLKVIAPDLAYSNDLNELAETFNLILEKENIDEVILFGQSGSGITAQIFFRRYHPKIKAMILINTVAPKSERNKRWASILLRLTPAIVLKSVFKKKMSKYFESEKLPKELLPRFMFTQFLLNKSLKERFSKRRLLLEIDNIFEFNNEGFLDIEKLRGWRGKVLIITSEDDPGYEDSKLLKQHLPNSELYIFSEGYGHLTPAVKADELKKVIGDFLNRLG